MLALAIINDLLIIFLGCTKQFAANTLQVKDVFSESLELAAAAISLAWVQLLTHCVETKGCCWSIDPLLLPSIVSQILVNFN